MVYVTGARPGLFLVDDEIEARWIVGSAVVNMTFGDGTEVYVFDRETEALISQFVVSDNPLPLIRTSYSRDTTCV